MDYRRAALWYQFYKHHSFLLKSTTCQITYRQILSYLQMMLLFFSCPAKINDWAAQWKMSFIADVNKQVEEVHSKEQNKKTMLAPTVFQQYI